jgi:hypothetical protein
MSPSTLRSGSPLRVVRNFNLESGVKPIQEEDFNSLKSSSIPGSVLSDQIETPFKKQKSRFREILEEN